MKFTVQLPASEIEPAGEFQTVAAVQQMAAAIEASGADACWVTDHPAPDAAWLRDPRGHDAVDPFVTLALAAGATTTLRLHTNVLILPYRNPFLTAKAVATLEVMAGGRMILGVGGGYQEGEFSALGVDFRKRGALMDEALETMMLAWSGEDVVKTGLFFDARGNLPRPVPPKTPTIWVGGAVDKALERVVKWGAGWCPFFGAADGGEFRKAQKSLSGIDELKVRVGQLREMLAAAGRTDPVDVCVNLPAPPARMDAAEAERTLETLGALAEAGATWVFTGHPHPSRAALLEHTAWFGEAVIARARS
jgi:probable F420-dependent oxidoreductase